MPRDGSSIYHRPPGTDGIPDTTIESTKYNAYVADIEQDLNLPRPIVAGGTGASSADAALVALGGEKAKQVVTNWDSTTWLPGSFYATTAATGISPIGTVPPTTPHAFAGIAYYANASDFVIEAIDLTSTLNPKWFRIMSAGVWGAWQPINAGLYVSKAGDTMAGPLLLPATPVADNSLKAATTAFVNQDAVIAAGVDLNTVTKTGTYACQNVNSNPNEPTGAGQWYLDVRTYGGATTYVVQHATNLIANSADIYTRVCIGGVWGPWQNLVNAANLTAVRYDIAQALSPAQMVQARQNIYAAPFDAMAYSGMQVNGAFEVSQAVGVNTPVVPPAWVCDQWYAARAGTASLQAGAYAASLWPGIPNCLLVTVAVAQAAMGANDYVTVSTTIEGYRTARLNWGLAGAAPLTIGFVSCHHRPGLYSVRIGNAGGARSYLTTYTHNVADTPQYNIITIPGDVAGTWEKTNNGGVYVYFSVACGSFYTAPSANTWLAGNYIAAPGQVNGVGATTDVFRLAGLVVLPGVEAPSGDRLPYIMRPFGQELETCKRYFQIVLAAIDYVTAGAGGIATQGVTFSPVMRATPTVTYSTLITGNSSAVATYSPSPAGFYPQTNSPAGGRSYWYGAALADARI